MNNAALPTCPSLRISPPHCACSNPGRFFHPHPESHLQLQNSEGDDATAVFRELGEPPWTRSTNGRGYTRSCRLQQDCTADWPRRARIFDQCPPKHATASFTSVVGLLRPCAEPKDIHALSTQTTWLNRCVDCHASSPPCSRDCSHPWKRYASNELGPILPSVDFCRTSFVS